MEFEIFALVFVSLEFLFDRFFLREKGSSYADLAVLECNKQTRLSSKFELSYILLCLHAEDTVMSYHAQALNCQ